MESVKFLKEPGFTYDLLSILMLYHNPESGMKIASIEDDDEDKAYFQSILIPFLPMADDLLIFFYLKDNNRFFMSEKYFDLQSNVFGTEDCRLQNILSELSNYDKVIRNMLHFYFRDVLEKELEAGAENLTIISKWIKLSTYPEKVKNALYDFFIEPIPLIQKLIHELLVKEVILEQLYQKEYQNLQKAQNEFDYVWLTGVIREKKNELIKFSGYEKIEVSWCLLYKNIICCKFCSEKLVLLLGVAFKERLMIKKNEEDLPELDTFGVVVSEKNRIEILNLMVKKRAITIKDIEQELGFTATNAYYHIVLMQKAGMLKTGNQGRTIWYSINDEYFIRLKSAMDKYIKLKKEER